ncbi:MAG: DUF86 domain-containing protein [Planctomycetota bacterium]|nr:DUF86 domain-containing protein [Planctomycetota bacterium]
MQPDAPDAALLWDMLDAAKAVREFTANRSLDDYLRDRMLRGAVERHVEIVGEAASKISKAFRDAHAGIPWQKIIAQRHVLVHEYGEIEHAFIWQVATVHIPALISLLQPLAPRDPPKPEP